MSASEVVSEEIGGLRRISDAVLGNEIYLYLNKDFPIEESIKNLKLLHKKTLTLKLSKMFFK